MATQTSGNFWVTVGASSAFIGVGMGAFGAHGLATRLDPRALSVFQTGAQYQMYHALALIGLGAWALRFPEISVTFCGWTFLVGTLLFSGSLYALAISGIKALGAITPLGGVAFLLGWLTFAGLAWKARF